MEFFENTAHPALPIVIVSYMMCNKWLFLTVRYNEMHMNVRLLQKHVWFQKLYALLTMIKYEIVCDQRKTEQNI